MSGDFGLLEARPSSEVSKALVGAERVTYKIALSL